MTGFNPYPGSYSPLPGIFGAPPPPLTPPYLLPWVAPPMPPVGADSATFSHQNGHQQKKQPWYMIFGKEVAKTALTVGASMAGFAMGGLPGAMIAGSASSAALSALDQQWSNGKIVWGSVLIDGALGLLPGIVGERVAKAGAGLLGKLAGKNVELAAKGTLKRAMLVGATDGAVMGYAGSTATCAYDTYQKTGKVDWKRANVEGAIGSVAGAIGGGLAGSAFSAFGRSRLPKTAPSPEAKPTAGTPPVTPEVKPASTVSPEPVKPPTKPAQPTSALPMNQDTSAVKTETPKPEPKQAVALPEVKPAPPQRPVTLQRKPRVKPRRHSDPIQPESPKIAPKAASSEAPTQPRQDTPQPKSILRSNKNTSPAAKTGTRVTFQEPAKPIRFASDQPTGNNNKTALDFLGNDLDQVHFRQKPADQGGNNTCHLLAPLDSMLHHPNGRRLLEKIKIQKMHDGNYQVQFPARQEAIRVTQQELNTGSGLTTGAKGLGLKIIERAYLNTPEVKAIRARDPKWNGFDSPINTLERIFGSGTEAIKLDSDKNATQFIGGIEFPFAERKQQFQEYLRQLKAGAGQTGSDIDVMAAMRAKNPNHYYSIRLNASTPEQIVLADSFASGKGTTQPKAPIPIDEFLNDYHIEGRRIPL